MTRPGVEEQQETGAAPSPALPTRRITWQKLTFLPLALVAMLLATSLWFRQVHLDPASATALARGQVSRALWQHIGLTVVSTFFVVVIAIPLGILLTRERFRKAAPAAMTIARTSRAVPAIALPALLVIWFGSGRSAALLGMVGYAVLPVLSHTMPGWSQPGVLTRAGLPLAVPLVLAGVRKALVLNVGTATLAAFAGGGGLGVLITTGISHQRTPVLLLGAIFTIALALLADWMASVAQLLVQARVEREATAGAGAG